MKILQPHHVHKINHKINRKIANAEEHSTYFEPTAEKVVTIAINKTLVAMTGQAGLTRSHFTKKG